MLFFNVLTILISIVALAISLFALKESKKYRIQTKEIEEAKVKPFISIQPYKSHGDINDNTLIIQLMNSGQSVMLDGIKIENLLSFKLSHIERTNDTSAFNADQEEYPFLFTENEPFIFVFRNDDILQDIKSALNGKIVLQLRNSLQQHIICTIFIKQGEAIL